MTPLTRPASEFQLTWSPILNLFATASAPVSISQHGRTPELPVGLYLPAGRAGVIEARHLDSVCQAQSSHRKVITAQSAVAASSSSRLQNCDPEPLRQMIIGPVANFLAFTKW